jgi:hypothetical protein
MNLKAARESGGFSFVTRGILWAEVFNMFVENSVQNRQSTSVSDSASDASTFCTGVSAGTFVVQSLFPEVSILRVQF